MIMTIYEGATVLITPVVLFFLYLIMPRLSRPDIVFGIRIPDEYVKDEPVRALYHSYTRVYLAVFIPLIIALSAVTLLFFNPFTMVGGLLILTAGAMLIYAAYHRKAAGLKQAKGWSSGKKETLVMDTSLLGKNRGRTLVSPLWFVLPAGIIAANAALIYHEFGAFPAEYRSSLIVQIAGLAVILAAYFITGSARIQIHSAQPQKSIYQNTRYRKLWSGFMVALSVVIVLLQTVLTMTQMGLILLSQEALSAIGFGVLIIILTATVTLSVRTGQSGNRIRVPDPAKPDRNRVDRSDDSHWKAGLFYFNPDDPSLFVEKRYGVGFTVNFGRPGGWIAIAVIIGGVILLSRLS